MKRIVLFSLLLMSIVLLGCSKEPEADLGNVSMVATRWVCDEEDLEMTFVSDSEVMVEYKYDGGGVGEYTKNGANITFKNFPVVTYMILNFRSGVLSTDGRTLSVKIDYTSWGDSNPTVETYIFKKK